MAACSGLDLFSKGMSAAPTPRGSLITHNPEVFREPGTRPVLVLLSSSKA